jgi:glycine/serine hydroxymethyltransferase
MKKIAAWIDAVVTRVDDESFLTKTAKDVEALCLKFPVPGLDE